MKLGLQSLLAFAIVAAIPEIALAQNPSSASPAPLPAKSSIAIPEPGDFALFMIGVAGLVIGRWTSRSRKRNRGE